MEFFAKNFMKRIIQAGFEDTIMEFTKNHPDIPKLHRPDDCPICMEEMHEVQYPLQCGHWVHDQCIAISIQHGNFYCPLCRASIIQNPQVIKALLEAQLEESPQLQFVMSICLAIIYLFMKIFNV